MLKKLVTKNFRKLEDNTFEFGPGLQVVRGANEAGKSTMLEAIGYALFGAKACREALAQIVTWGKPANSVAVELVLELGGVEYVVTRSARGAEVNYAGGRVTGQNEVSAFLARQLGADGASATKLMLAPQGAIRGALDEGAAKTVKLIEELADFTIVDYVVELIQSNLLTGPATLAEDRVKSAGAALEAAKLAAAAPDTADLDDEIRLCGTGISQRRRSIDTNLKPWFERAQAELGVAQAAHTDRENLRAERLRAETERLNKRSQLEAARRAVTGPSAVLIEEARNAVRLAEDAAAQRAIYEQFSRLKLPEMHWEGDKASFEAEVGTVSRLRETAASLYQAAKKDMDAARAEIRVLEAQRVTGSACGFCGKDVSGVPEVVAKNQAIDAAIAQQRAALALAESAVAENERVAVEAAQALLDLETVRKSAEPFEAFLARHGDCVIVELLPATYPPGLSWDGAVPDGSVGVEVLRGKLEGLEAAAKAATAAAARAELLEKQVEEDGRRLEVIDKRIKERSAAADQRNGLKAAFDEAQRAYNGASGEIAELTYRKDKLEMELKSVQAAYAAAKRGVEAAEKALAQAQAELAELEFNNALLKRVRQARPVIADKLWSIVLAAVSNYFSQMRGTKSLVTREGNEFKVDGRPIEGLSGSTLDILGLAIRLALTRTFLPNSPLLILDEPAAAMDEDRTASTMGFLQAAGFTQTLVVTHEDQTESAAANLITL